VVARRIADGVLAQGDPGKGWGAGTGLAAMLLLGLGGLAINVFLPINISWGVHLLFGGSVALVSARLLSPFQALGTVLLATLPTLLLWGHWFAVAIMCCEVAWICVAARRGWSMVSADLVYWLVAGCPASVIASLAWGEAPLEVAMLIAAKLGLNGLMNASVAEILYLAMLRSARLRRSLPMPKASATHVLLATLSSFVVVPGLAASLAFSLLEMRGVEREMERELKDYELDAVAATVQVLDLAAEPLGNLAPRFARETEAIPPAVLALAGPAPWESMILLDTSRPAIDPPAAECWASTLRTRLAGADMTGGDMVVSVPAQGPCHASLLVVRALEGTRLAVLRASSATVARMIIEKASGRPLRDDRIWLAGIFDGQDRFVAMSASVGTVPDRLPSLPLPQGQATLPARDLGYFKRDLQYWVARTTVDLPAIPGWRIGVAISSLTLRADAQRAQAAILGVAFMLVCAVVVAGSAIATAVGRRLRFSAARSGERADSAPMLPLEEMDLVESWIRGVVEDLRTERWTSDAFRARLEAFEAMAPVITYVAEDATDQGSPVLAYSSSISRVLGVQPEAAVAAGWMAASIHPDDQARVRATFGTGVGPSGLQRETYRLRGADGRYRWFMDTRVRLAGGEGSRVLHGLMLEVTDQKEAERQLVQAAKLAQIGELAVSMGHELSQPLNVIRLAASNLQAASEAGPLPREQLAVRLDRIVRQVDKATSLLSHLKVFGRRASEQPLAPFDLAGVIDGALLVLRGTLSSAGIAVAVDVRASEYMAHGSAILVEQCLVNLLANAADAIGARQEREPGLVGRIAISVAEDGQFLHLGVADNGGGIPLALQDRIFEPFFTTKPPGKGTGLGLSISRRAMQEMGGNLLFASEDEGAVFTIIVPRA
jgi:signal transduction histidine kinase